MIDIGKEPIDFECPNCGKALKLTFNDAIARRTIRCSSCGTDINLTPDESLKREVDSVNKSFRDLEKTLKKLSR